MKNYIKLVGIFALFAYFCSFLPNGLAAGRDTYNITAARLDSTVYEFKTVDEIATDFENEGKASLTKYINSHIALFGQVENISKNAFQLGSAGTVLQFDIQSNAVKDQLETLNKDSSVLVYGKVKKANNKKFVLKADTVIAVSQSDLPSSVILDSQGNVFSNSAGHLNGVIYWPANDWQLTDCPSLENYKLRSGIEESVCYDLGNGEYLMLYSLDWQKLKRISEDAQKGTVIQKATKGDEECARDFLAYEFRLGKVHKENIGKKKTDYLVYDYYIGSNKSDDSIRGEAFFVKLDDSYLALNYVHGDNALHAQEVASFLGSIRFQTA